MSGERERFGTLEYRRICTLMKSSTAVISRYQDRDGKDVVIRVQHGQGEARNPTSEDRFCRAMAGLARMGTLPVGIIRIYAHGRLTGHPNFEDGVPFAVVEFVDSERTLEHLRIDRGGRLVEREVVSIGCHLASTLRGLHEEGVALRSLKPSDVLLVGDSVPKIVDAVCARAAGQEDAYTPTGAVLGNPLYLAPETYRTPAFADGSADVYSLGCILYELLIGMPPFQQRPGTPQQRAEQSIIEQHLQEGTRAPALLGQDPLLSPALCHLVERMLAKRPEARPTAREVAEALRAMGYERQVSLRGLLQRVDKLHFMDVLRLTREIIPAVREARRAGSRSMICPECVQIVLAKDRLGGLDRIQLSATPSGTNLQPYRDAAPQQHVQDEFGSEVFALGIVLYEALAGRLPGPPGAALGTTSVPPLSPMLPPDYPPELVQLVYRMMDRNPHRRPRLEDVESEVHSLLQPAPKELGEYRVCRRLGKGAMAAVYEVRKGSGDVPLALKILEPLPEGDEVHRRFELEFKTLQRLVSVRHEGIVAVNAYGKLPGGRRFIEMAYLQGESLMERIRRMGTLSSGEVVRIGLQAARALDVVHRHGIWHRDIKPQNLMITGSGSNEQITIIDFGVAKMRGWGSGTIIGTSLGTPPYCAPEQRANAAGVDDRADVYSLGVVLYECLAADKLFSAHLPQSPSRKAPLGQPLAGEGNGELSALLQWMMREQPTERPSMAEVCARLEQLARPHAAPPAAPPQTVHTTPRSYREGDLLAGYRLDRLLRESGSSAAFLATKLADGSSQAVVKVIYPHLALDEREVSRFHEEIQTLRRHRVPGVVQVLDFKPLPGGAICAIMEHVQGVSLGKRRIEEGGRLPVYESALIFYRAAEVMAGVHASGLIHRSLDPDNLIIRAVEGEVVDVKVLFTGLGRVLPHANAKVDNSIYGTIGRPLYAAPELRASGQQITDRVDVFALGGMFFEALFGQRPGHGAPILGEPRQVPPALKSLAQEMVSMDPRQRPSMSEVAARLAAWQRAQTIGEYRILYTIGMGGMGEVVAAKDSSGRLVAIKRILQEMITNDGLVQRFTREAEVLRRITHPGVVRILEVGKQGNGVPYLAMELLTGETLQARMKAGRIPAETAREVACQISMAMAAVHASGIAHRDLKPGNLMLVKGSDGKAQVKVLDFGLARLRDPGGYRTVAGQLMGTPEYMAPEQANGLDRADAMADVYSLGVILYEMLCGQLPFLEKDPISMMMAHLQKPPPDIRTISPQVPEGEWLLIRQMLDKNPIKRPSMKEVADRLGGRNDRSSGEETVILSPPEAPGGLMDRLWPFARTPKRG